MSILEFILGFGLLTMSIWFPIVAYGCFGIR